MIYERLKELRLANNLTQADFAAAFNISQGTIGNWESGKRTPDIEMIIKISISDDIGIFLMLVERF